MDHENLDILIVDDDEGHAELVSRNLRRSGITNRLVPLASGDEALEYVYARGNYEGRSSSNPLLMLLDINMPGSVDGVEVLRRLKADPKKRAIPVVMLTTTDEPRQINQCYDLGCNVYVTKPIDPTKFIAAIRRIGLFIAVVKVPSAEPAKA